MTASLIDASALPLAEVRRCVRAHAQTFTWRGLTDAQLGILDVWAEARRGSTVEGTPLPTTSGVLAGAVDVALRALDDPKLDLPCLSEACAVIAEYANTVPQARVRGAVRALLAAMNARA